MIYVSTRNPSVCADFRTAVLSGLAPDGGLFVPTSVPHLGRQDLHRLQGADRTRLGEAILAPFAAETLSAEALGHILRESYASFSHPSVVPLVEVAPRRWILELFHGPSLAFKDHALQVLGRLLRHFLEEVGRKALVLCATSGDTGGAALSALRDVDAARALVLYPQGGVSTFQEAQMQDLSTPTRRVIAVAGSFDDCQRLVKGALRDRSLCEMYGLTAFNSVNWARIAAQAVYYADASLRLGQGDALVDFAVPTGNFGNAYSGLLARRMGFPVGRIHVATNENDALVRVAKTGQMDPASVVPTNTPAMDIQVPSNFERLLYELIDQDRSGGTGTGVERFLAGTRLTSGMRTRLNGSLCFARVGQDAVIARMRTLFDRTGYVADPHTALAMEPTETVDTGGRHLVTLATAHPAKFAETVETALGFRPPLSRGRVAAFDGISPSMAADALSLRFEIEKTSLA